MSLARNLLNAHKRTVQKASNMPQAKRPFQFIVGRFIPLNWNRQTPPGFRTLSTSRM